MGRSSIGDSKLSSGKSKKKIKLPNEDEEGELKQSLILDHNKPQNTEESPDMRRVDGEPIEILD